MGVCGAGVVRRGFSCGVGGRCGIIEWSVLEGNMKSNFCINCPCRVPGKECVYCYWNRDNDDSFDYGFDKACSGHDDKGNDGFHIVGNKKKSKK